MLFPNVLNCLLLSTLIFFISQTLSQHRDHPDQRLFPPVSNNPDDIKFYLYPSAAHPNYSEEIQFRDDGSLRGSSFRPNSVTVFYIHGYLYLPGISRIHPIINAYLASGIEGNFIFVYWDKLSNPVLSNGTLISFEHLVEASLGYVEVLPNVPIAGTRLAEFICWLCQQGVIAFSQIHLIGFSLGASVAGYAGSKLQELGGGERIRRITGLDPAGPLVEVPIKLEHALDREDANFVDVIHANFGIFGTYEKNGDVDIFLNHGSFQPGCKSLDIAFAVNCSHAFVEKVYVAAIQKPLVACACPSWKILFGGCHHQPCSEPLVVGPYALESARGMFHLQTGKDP